MAEFKPVPIERAEYEFTQAEAGSAGRELEARLARLEDMIQRLEERRRRRRRLLLATALLEALAPR